MEPLKPDKIKELLKYGSQEELDEYERLLSKRFQQDPSKQRTQRKNKLEKRLKELYGKFYPVESTLSQKPLYACILKMPTGFGMPAIEKYSICPKTNYTPDKQSRTAIGVSRDAIEIILKDVKIDNKQIKFNGRSVYDFELNQLSRDANGVKLEGKLKKYDFGLGHQGKDYTGSTICGYVDRIEREKDQPKIKMPDFDF